MKKEDFFAELNSEDWAPLPLDDEFSLEEIIAEVRAQMPDTPEKMPEGAENIGFFGETAENFSSEPPGRREPDPEEEIRDSEPVQAAPPVDENRTEPQSEEEEPGHKQEEKAEAAEDFSEPEAPPPRKETIKTEEADDEELYAQIAAGFDAVEKEAAERAGGSASRRRVRVGFPGRRTPQLFPDEEPPEGTTVEIRADAHRKNRKAPYKDPLPLDFNGEETLSGEEGAALAGKTSRMYALRALLCAVVSLVALWLTCAPFYSLWLPPGFSYMETPYLYIFAMTVCQLVCMGGAVDLIASGLWRLACLHPTIDSLLAVSQIAVLLHSLTILIFPAWGGYMPYSALACVSAFFSMLGRKEKYSALRRQIKVASISQTPVGVFVEEDASGKNGRVHKSRTEVTEELLKRLHERTMTDRCASAYVPIMLTAGPLFALLSSVGRGEASRFPWALAAVFSAEMSAALVLSSSLPIYWAARRLFSSGAAIMGFEGLQTMKRCRRAVMRDEDVFPPGSVGINGIKIVGEMSFETVLAYTASAVDKAQLGVARVFNDLLAQQYIKTLPVERLRYYESGGISAEINGDTVLIGTAGFLLRMGVRVKEGLNLKNGVFTAINSSLVGIFAMKYTANFGTVSAFDLLRRSRVSPVLAVRDFNMTPGMVESIMKLKRGTTEYPDIALRLDLSEGNRFFPSLPTALLARDGALPFAESIGTMNRLRRAITTNLAMGLFSSAVGALLVFFLCYKGAYAAAAPINLLIYHLLWLLPLLFSSLRTLRH